MKENDAFPKPIITPATKAEEGHDEDISILEIKRKGLVSDDVLNTMVLYTHALYKKGVEMAASRGLILVDTKYEFGLYDDEVIVIDEIHTPDSSRYFYADTYERNQQLGIPQKHLSKEFVREWLMENGFQGLDGQQMPEMSEQVVNSISKRYVELYEQLTGRNFEGESTEHLEQAIIAAL